MKNCIKCNTQLDDKAIFCSQCGTKQWPLGAKCIICNSNLPKNAKFCPICGTKLEWVETENWNDCDYACVKTGEHYCFIRPDGSYLTAPIFDDASDFRGGLAAVEIYYKPWLSKTGYIGKDGRFTFAPKFDDGYSFSEGFAVVKVGEKFGYIKSDGSFAVKPIIIKAESFSQGKAKVKIKGQKWGDPIKEGEFFPDGTLVIDGKPVDVTQFHHVSLTAKINHWGKEGFADVEHYDEWVIPPQFDYVGRFGDDDYAIIALNGKYGFIGANGEILVKPNYDDVGPFSEGLARVRIGEKHGFIKTDGSYLVEPQFVDADECFEGGHVRVKITGDKKVKILCHDGTIIDDDKLTDLLKYLA